MDGYDASNYTESAFWKGFGYKYVPACTGPNTPTGWCVPLSLRAVIVRLLCVQSLLTAAPPLHHAPAGRTAPTARRTSTSPTAASTTTTVTSARATRTTCATASGASASRTSSRTRPSSAPRAPTASTRRCTEQRASSLISQHLRHPACRARAPPSCPVSIAAHDAVSPFHTRNIGWRPHSRTCSAPSLPTYAPRAAAPTAYASSTCVIDSCSLCTHHSISRSFGSL